MRPEFGPDIFESRAQASAAREAQIDRSRAIADEIGLTPQEISEIEAGADEISLFGKIRDKFGGLIANAKQSMVVRVAAVGVILSAAASACENPIKSDPRDNPEKTPTVLTPEPRETGTPLVIPTVTKTPAETETAEPTDTVEPTKTPTKKPTEKPTPKPTPSETPSPTDTPTAEPTPENILEQEPFVTMFQTLEEIDWSKFTGGDQIKNLSIPSFRELLKFNLPIAFQDMVNLSSSVLLYKGDDAEYPAEPKETEEHKIVREKVIIPFKDWLEKKFPKASHPELWMSLQASLDRFPWDWHPERLASEPFSIWSKQMDERADNDFAKLYARVFKWRVVSGDFQNLGAEITGNGCPLRERGPFFKWLTDELWPQYYQWVKDYQPETTLVAIEEFARQANCPIPQE